MANKNRHLFEIHLFIQGAVDIQTIIESEEFLFTISQMLHFLFSKHQNLWALVRDFFQVSFADHKMQLSHVLNSVLFIWRFLARRNQITPRRQRAITVETNVDHLTRKSVHLQLISTFKFVLDTMQTGLTISTSCDLKMIKDCSENQSSLWQKTIRHAPLFDWITWLYLVFRFCHAGAQTCLSCHFWWHLADESWETNKSRRNVNFIRKYSFQNNLPVFDAVANASKTRHLLIPTPNNLSTFRRQVQTLHVKESKFRPQTWDNRIWDEDPTPPNAKPFVRDIHRRVVDSMAKDRHRAWPNSQIRSSCWSHVPHWSVRHDWIDANPSDGEWRCHSFDFVAVGRQTNAVQNAIVAWNDFDKAPEQPIDVFSIEWFAFC